MNNIYAIGNYFFVKLEGDNTPCSDAKGNVVVNISSDLSENLLSASLTVNTTSSGFGDVISTIELDGDFSTNIIANVTDFSFTYLDAGLVEQKWTGKATNVVFIPMDDKTYITPDFQGFTPVTTSGSNMTYNQKLYLFELSYLISSPKIGQLNLALSTLADENGIAYNQSTWETFYLANSGFNPASGGSGAGDMTKSVYDTNDDGIVDTADKEMIQVINKTGVTITKGSIVYLKSTSSSGTHPEILLADADTEETSSKTLGAVYENILPNALGYVVTSGEVRNAVTNAYPIGTKLWLSSTPGQVQSTPPIQPAHSVFIGTVTRSQSNNGRILYAIQNGYELQELHNVLLADPIDKELLYFDEDTQLWKNNKIGFIYGLTNGKIVKALSDGTLADASFNENDINAFTEKPNCTWRGISFNNNSTTIVQDGGIVASATASTLAQSVANTNYVSKNIRLRYYASVVSGGRYTGIRGSALLWFIGGGFLFQCDFNISDTAFGAGCQNFVGMASTIADLGIGGVSLIQLSTLTNIIGVGNDGSDANLQIMSNDAAGVCSKVDLGVNFPANRSSGAIMTTIYSVSMYNAPSSSQVLVRIRNKETGIFVDNIISSNLPASTLGLNFFAARTMNAALTNTGQFDLSKLGVYSI
jgi:hypothetical protein